MDLRWFHDMPGMRGASVQRYSVLDTPPFGLESRLSAPIRLCRRRTRTEMVPKATLNRSILNKFLFGSLWPITKAMFKEPFVKGIRGRDFFTPETLSLLTTRINTVSTRSQRQWGTMTPDQMVHHLNLATGSALGYFDLPDESYFLSRTISKWILVDLLSEQPKGLLLPLTFKIAPTEHFDLENEKRLLLEIVTKACSSKTTKDWGPHPLFGRMSDTEWGRLYTVHIDYHLRQFGA